MPPSEHDYTPNELPAPFFPGGQTWMKWRLEQANYHDVGVWTNPTQSRWYLRVLEPNVSRNQLLFDIQPAETKLACNHISTNVPPMSTQAVTVTGPPGKTVKVRFDGIAFVSETEFVLPGNGNYNYIFGPCPAGQRVVIPQQFEFYVEDGSCSPVAVQVTFT